jgi:membrane associated rhomboid family serine protease
VFEFFLFFDKMSDKTRLKNSIIAGLLPVIFIWVIVLLAILYDLDLSFLGVFPREISGLTGIITAPLIHADAAHAASNSVPMFVSVAIIFYFYREVFWQVIIFIWIMTGVWVWSFAGPGYHVGASGIVYGYISFLFFSGIIRRNVRLMAISLLMVFLYGGLFWGIFPDFYPNRNISWESHLMGGLSGLVIAIFFRKTGTQKEEFHWPDEEDEDDENAYWKDTDFTGKP